MSHVLVLTTDDEPAALARVHGLMRRRDLRIHSLSTAPGAQAGTAMITLRLEGDARSAHRVAAQLRRLVCLLQAEVLPQEAPLRELALVRVAASEATLAMVLRAAQALRASVVDVAPDSLLLEHLGRPEDTDALLEALSPFGILDATRSGGLGLARTSASQAAEPRLAASF